MIMYPSNHVLHAQPGFNAATFNQSSATLYPTCTNQELLQIAGTLNRIG